MLRTLPLISRYFTLLPLWNFYQQNLEVLVDSWLSLMVTLVKIPGISNSLLKVNNFSPDSWHIAQFYLTLFFFQINPILQQPTLPNRWLINMRTTFHLASMTLVCIYIHRLILTRHTFLFSHRLARVSTYAPSITFLSW